MFNIRTTKVSYNIFHFTAEMVDGFTKVAVPTALEKDSEHPCAWKHMVTKKFIVASLEVRSITSKKNHLNLLELKSQTQRCRASNEKRRR